MFPSGERHGIGRRGVLAGAGSMVAAPAVVRAQGQSGVALVIGNSKYKWEASLPNVKRDAPDVARALQALGLKTELVQDASRDALRAAVDKFARAARGANFAALYFAGHGASWEKDTYLVPEDADLGDPSAVRSLLAVSAVSEATKDAAHRLLVFDSCRNNPADGWRQKAATESAVSWDTDGASLARSPNTLVLFSTAPGRTALDGPAGENSPFAAAVLRQLAELSIDLQALPAKLRRDLLIATQGRQIVWDQNSYAQPFAIAGAGHTAHAGGAPAGWSGDPARIVELPKAYAFAQKNGLLLPAGLIAHRPGQASREGQKVGSYQFEKRSGRVLEPSLLIVMSVEDQHSAQAIGVSRKKGASYWRFVNGTLSGDTLDYTPWDEGARHVFKWSDANSGSFSQLWERRAGGNLPPFNGHFTRLDG